MTRHADADHAPPTTCALGRREFLKRLAVASAAAARASAAPGALGAASVAAPIRSGDLQWHRAPCTLCGVGCGLLVAAEGGRLVATKGDPDSPVSRGLACVKGYHAVQALYAPDRLTRATVRRGGAHAGVPLPAALDLVAGRLRDILARHGPDAVGVYGPNRWSFPEAHLAATLFGDLLGSRNVDGGARLAGASVAAGLASTFGLDGSVGCFDDIEHADVIVLWGANVAETHPRLWARMLERRRRDPAVRIVELSTRTTRTSYAVDRSFLHAPRAEIAIANALCHEIVARGWTDRAFVERHVAFKRGAALPPSGAASAPLGERATDATWREYTRFLDDYSPARAQRVSGVPQDDIRWLAALYANPSLRVTTLWGAGAIRHARGTWVSNALLAVHLLLGKIAMPGSGAMGLAEPAWPRATARPPRDALAIFDAFARGELRFLWVQSADPMTELPDLRRYRRAASGDRFLVVSDAYPTPTTAMADVVLPSAMWLEREGMVVNPERRVQRFARVVSPPGDATSESRQMLEVARRLGLAARLRPPPDDAAWSWEEYRSAADRREPLPTLAALRARPGVLWPSRGDVETRWRYNTAHDPAAERARGAFDFYGHADHRAWIWLRPHEPPVEVPDDAYPFWLETGEVLEHSDAGTVTRRIPTLRRAVPVAYAEMNRDDAERLGVRIGDLVRITSRRGALELPVRVELRSQPPRGQIFVPWFDAEHPVNLLTLGATCPLSGQPDYGCAVRVERAGARGRAT